MNDWQDYNRPGGLGTPLVPIKKRKRGEGDETQWWWAIAIAVACLIGWATIKDPATGHDHTVQCIAPATNCG